MRGNAIMIGNASVSQSNAFHANTTAQAVANQITFMVTTQEREAPKKKMADQNSVEKLFV